MSIIRATDDEHVLVCVTGDHPLALGDNLGVEITTAGSASADSNSAGSNSAGNSIRVVDIDDHNALMFALGIRLYDPTDVDRVTPGETPPDVASRVLALTRAWALWL